MIKTVDKVETITTPAIQEPLSKQHLFKPGSSGNPAGRPVGSKNKMKALAEGLLGNNAKKIVKKVIEMALDGNEACLKMCMDRIIPAQRAVDGNGDRGGNSINIIIESADRKVIVNQETSIPVQDVEDVEENS
jgi:hypothetical protein